MEKYYPVVFQDIFATEITCTELTFNDNISWAGRLAQIFVIGPVMNYDGVPASKDFLAMQAFKLAFVHDKLMIFTFTLLYFYIFQASYMLFLF